MEALLKRSKSHLCSALLKYGRSNFSLEILEYCEPDKCLEREGYYLKTLNPEYNIAKKPGASMSGRKNSDESKKRISDAHIGLKKGEKNPMFGQNHTDESKQKISDTKKGQPKVDGSGKPSQQIEVTDITNNTRLLIILLVKLQEP